MRRWTYNDSLIRLMGEKPRHRDRLEGRYFTAWGARLSVSLIAPFLRSRGGQAALILRDRRTGAEEVLHVS